jgi:Cof subfamily protein (haloacid dehalogenase superfamily)
MKTLYVSDLDGTLLQPDARLSERTVALLGEAVAAGHLFTVATARTPATVAPILQRVDMRLPAIVMTGAAMWDTATGHYSHVRHFAPDTAAGLLRIYREAGISTFIFTLSDDMIDIYHLNGDLLPLQRAFMEERMHSPYKRFHVDPSGADTLPDTLSETVLFYTMLPDALAREAYMLIKDLPGVRAQYYHDIYGPETGILEAFAAGATKAEAVRTLAAATGADRTVCFGDNINDLPMMEAADLAVAVGNALPEVKRAADIVIGCNTDDAVAAFIRAGL